MLLGQAVFEAGVLLETLGPVVKESSQRVFERIKDWSRNLFRGGVGL